MIIFDFETTGLVKAQILDLSQQPKAIEFAAIKLDDKTLEEVDRIEFLLDPKIEITAEITKITGIKNEDLVGKPEFWQIYPQMAKFFLGEKYAVAHNIAFDMQILKCELMRIGKVDAFPWPIIRICTVNQTLKLIKGQNYRLSLGALYTHLFGDIMPQGHRAMVDVEALAKVTKELINKKVIKIC